MGKQEPVSIHLQYLLLVPVDHQDNKTLIAFPLSFHFLTIKDILILAFVDTDKALQKSQLPISSPCIK